VITHVQRGRLDQALLAILERVCAREIEPRLGVPLWPDLKPLATRGLKRLGVPRIPLTPPQLELAQAGLGIARAVCSRGRRVS
jgi:hypothetical protein